jgi:uncharacterized protein YbjT (DUF2867 family)
MASKKNRVTVLITGATGKQGGAVLRHLVRESGFAIRAMSRNPAGDAARAVAALGCEVVRGDLDDPRSLERALDGVWGVFGVQNTWEAGVAREEEQGKRLAELARQKGVQHYVYSSVGSAERNTGIPHFENKWRVEQTVRALGFPSYAILRPVFFMENLISPWFLRGDKLISALGPETLLQMVAVDDIGKFGALLIAKGAELSGAEIELAGDAATLPRAAALLGEASGQRTDYVRISIEEVRKSSEDFALMLEWFERVGYNADIAGLEAKYGIRLTRLSDWVRHHVNASRPPAVAV